MTCKDRDILCLFTPMFLALYSPAPCRPESESAFLSISLQVNATFTGLNTGRWEGGFVLSASCGVTLIFLHVSKAPHMQKFAAAIAYFIATPSSGHHLRKTTHIFHAIT